MGKLTDLTNERRRRQENPDRIPATMALAPAPARQKEATTEEAGGGRQKEPRGVRGWTPGSRKARLRWLTQSTNFLRQKKPDNAFVVQANWRNENWG